MKKSFKIIITLLLSATLLFLLAALSVFGINCHVKSSAENHFYTVDTIPRNSQYDCILVLGCGVYPDGTPSPMLEDRLKKAVELYKNNTAPKLLMSGDHGQKGYDEVNIMREYAIKYGVPEEDIFMDHAGFST